MHSRGGYTPPNSATPGMVVAGPVPPGTLFRADCGARAVTSPTHRLGNAWSSDPPMEIRQFLSKCIARRCFLTCLRDRHNRDRNSPRSAGTAPELLFLRSYQMTFIANVRWAARDSASRIGSGITCVFLHPVWVPECSVGLPHGSGTWCGGFLTRMLLRIAYEILLPHVSRDPVRSS